MAVKIQKRNPFRLANKHQYHIILSVMVPALFCLVISLLSIYYISFIAHQLALYNSADFSRPEVYTPWILNINRWMAVIPWILFAISFSIFALVIWIFDFSNRLVGPYGRVLRELDEILEGKNKGKISLRRKDEFLGDLIKRINILIQRLSK